MLKKTNNKPSPHYRAGFSLIDSIISLMVVAVMILVFAGLAGVRETNRRVTFRTQAAALADEEINALRRLDVANVADQTNGSFKNVMYNAGTWRIAVDGDNVLELAGATGFSGLISGRLLFPAGQYGDATLQADWKIMADSPSGWAFGYTLRGTDENNRYRLRIAVTGTDFDGATGGNQNFILEKIVAGSATKIVSAVTSPSIATNTTYTVKVIMTGASIQTYINGTQQGIAPDDTTFTSGQAALIGGGGIHAEIDDVQTIVGATTTTWNFESDTNLPAAWIRLSLNDLPDSTPTTFDDNGLLTIAPFLQPSSVNLKKATITIQWRQGGGLASFTTSGLLGKSSIGL